MAGFLVNVGKAGEVAERSPAVISANLKEDMLLQKKIVILNRSERSVVHQIRVDQKVLYKRFQSRLVRSKLAFARIVGNKDLEKELRSKNLGGLNTDIVGHTDEECSFLDKLEHRPCTATSFSPRVVTSVKKRGVMKQKRSPREERASSATARLEAIAENDTENTSGEAQSPGSMRPATTIGLRLNTNMLLQNRMKRRQMSPIEEGVELLTDTKIKNGQIEPKDTTDGQHEKERDESVTSKATDDEAECSDQAENDNNGDKTSEDDGVDDKKQTVAFLDELDLSHVRPRSMGNLQTCEESPPISPKQLSRRTSKAADFFQEQKKIDLVGLRLQEAKSKDYTDRIQSFCDDIETMIGPSNRPSIDYYASRLQTSMQHRLDKPPTNVPGTPEDENKRAIGNIFVRSLTLPVLNLEY